MGKAAFSAVEVKRAVRTLEAVGKHVSAVEFRADGAFVLLTTPEPVAERSAPGQWGDDAGEEEISRA